METKDLIDYQRRIRREDNIDSITNTFKQSALGFAQSFIGFADHTQGPVKGLQAVAGMAFAGLKLGKSAQKMLGTFLSEEEEAPEDTGSIVATPVSRTSTPGGPTPVS